MKGAGIAYDGFEAGFGRVRYAVAERDGTLSIVRDDA